MDLDGDGKKDLISGNYATDNVKGIGRIYLIKGLGNGKFATPSEVKRKDGKPAIPAKVIDKGVGDPGQICIHPFAADWDADGDLDLIIGNFEGSFSLILNEKGGAGMSFSNEVAIMKDTSGNKLKCPGKHSAPFVIDWDKDGDLDLLSGDSYTGLSWSENVGTKTNPQLIPFKPLISLKTKHLQKLGNGKNYKPGFSFRPWIADVNGDGKLDVLLGDKVKLTKPAEGMSKIAYFIKKRAWEKKEDKLLEVFSDERKKIKHLLNVKNPNEEQRKLLEPFLSADEKLSAHNQTRSEFITEVNAGHVWLFLAK